MVSRNDNRENFQSWTERLQERGNVKFRGGAKVTAINDLITILKNNDNDKDKDGTDGLFRISINDGAETIDCDAIVFAIGGTALKRILPACPPLTKLPETKSWEKFRGVTCVAVRLFFDSEISPLKDAMRDSPVVVCGANIGEIPELSETGFCIYDLERLQDGNDVVSAIEVDFFRADSLGSMEDKEVVQVTLKAIAAALKIPNIHESLVADLSVVRANNAVSHFCVNSASWSPDVKLSEGLYICGDWVDRTGHASWSTEKAVVTGIQAANALAGGYDLKSNVSVIPAASDTPQLAGLRQLARTVRGAIPFGLDIKPQAPWILAKRLFLGR